MLRTTRTGVAARAANLQSFRLPNWKRTCRDATRGIARNVVIVAHAATNGVSGHYTQVVDLRITPPSPSSDATRCNISLKCARAQLEPTCAHARRDRRLRIVQRRDCARLMATGARFQRERTRCLRRTWPCARAHGGDCYGRRIRLSLRVPRNHGAWTRAKCRGHRRCDDWSPFTRAREGAPPRLNENNERVTGVRHRLSTALKTPRVISVAQPSSSLPPGPV